MIHTLSDLKNIFKKNSAPLLAKTTTKHSLLFFKPILRRQQRKFHVIFSFLAGSRLFLSCVICLHTFTHYEISNEPVGGKNKNLHKNVYERALQNLRVTCALSKSKILADSVRWSQDNNECYKKAPLDVQPMSSKLKATDFQHFRCCRTRSASSEKAKRELPPEYSVHMKGL